MPGPRTGDGVPSFAVAADGTLYAACQDVRLSNAKRNDGSRRAARSGLANVVGCAAMPASVIEIEIERVGVPAGPVGA